MFTCEAQECLAYQMQLINGVQFNMLFLCFYEFNWDGLGKDISTRGHTNCVL